MINTAKSIVGGGVQRSSSISIIRFLSLLMIITCHILQYTGSELAWWFNVGVQIFLCISGFLYGQRNVGEITEFYHKRFKKVLVPYFIVIGVAVLLQLLLARDAFSLKKTVGSLILRSRISGGEHLWFVSTILICYVVTPLIEAYRNRYAKDKKGFCLWAISTVAVLSIFFGLFNGFFNPAWIACYAIGYVLGVNEEKRYISFRLLLIMFGAIAVIGNGIQIYCQYIAHRELRYWEIIYDYNHLTLGVFLFLVLKQVLDRMEVKRNGLLELSDRYSYEAYLVHQFLILGPFSLMALTPVLGLNIVIIVAGVMMLTVLLKFVEERVSTAVDKVMGDRVPNGGALWKK